MTKSQEEQEERETPFLGKSKEVVPQAQKVSGHLSEGQVSTLNAHIDRAWYKKWKNFCFEIFWAVRAQNGGMIKTRNFFSEIFKNLIFISVYLLKWHFWGNFRSCTVNYSQVGLVNNQGSTLVQNRTPTHLSPCISSHLILHSHSKRGRD
jgi:hypothetical protein